MFDSCIVLVHVIVVGGCCYGAPAAEGGGGVRWARVFSFYWRERRRAGVVFGSPTSLRKLGLRALNLTKTDKNNNTQQPTSTMSLWNSLVNYVAGKSSTKDREALKRGEVASAIDEFNDLFAEDANSRGRDAKKIEERKKSYTTMINQ